MSGARKQRTRQDRIESLGIEKPRLIQWWQESDKADFAIRVSLAVVAAVALLVFCRSWRPPFAYRTDHILAHDLITRVTFEKENEQETQALRERARKDTLAFYSNRRQPLLDRQAELLDQLFLVLGAPSFDQMKPEERNAFAQFFQGDETKPEDTPAKRFAIFKTVFADDPKLETLRKGLDIVFQKNYRLGLIQGLEDSYEPGG